PTEGPYSGGTRVTIDGSGFVAPVAVVIGGVAAQGISVSGKRILAPPSAAAGTRCAHIQAEESRRQHMVNGGSPPAAAWTHRLPLPAIINIIDLNGGPTNPGDPLQVIVANAYPGTNRITIDDRDVFITGSTFDANGVATFNVAVPTLIDFDTEACIVAGVSGE